MPTSLSAKNSIIAVTLGDPGGVGPEVTVKALSSFRRTPAFRKNCVILIGPAYIYEEWFRRLKVPFSAEVISSLDPKRLCPGSIYILDLAEALFSVPVRMGGGLAVKILPDAFERGKVSKENAILSYASLRIGAYLAACGQVQALTTAPINKEAMRLLDPGFIGHTEYLARVSNTRHYAMLFDGGSLKVALATIHLPLSRVSSVLTREKIRGKIEICHQFLTRYYRIPGPRIAVCALNPHGKEFGSEEEDVIAPSIRAMQKKGICASGPHPGDTVFHEALRGKYDLVLAMYHDQGLAPLKTLEFHNAVNVTAGLPFIRTSPDHGTAFDIAFRNKANPGSMLSALALAGRLVMNVS